MQDLIESAIERETEILDTFFETAGILEHQSFAAHGSDLEWPRHAHKFSGRATSRRRFSTRAAKSHRHSD
jgi:hypothetical protein